MWTFGLSEILAVKVKVICHREQSNPQGSKIRADLLIGK